MYSNVYDDDTDFEKYGFIKSKNIYNSKTKYFSSNEKKFNP